MFGHSHGEGGRSDWKCSRCVKRWRSMDEHNLDLLSMFEDNVDGVRVTSRRQSWQQRIDNKNYRHKTKINYSLSFFSPSLCFLTLLACQVGSSVKSYTILAYPLVYLHIHQILIRELVQSSLMPVILNHVSREYVLHEIFFFSEEE